MKDGVDGTLPIAVTHFVERDGEMFHLHGGVATKVRFESLEEMPIDDFFRDVAPTLAGKRDVVVFGRDSVHENMYRLLGDTAVIYHGVQIQDVFMDQFYKGLQEDKPLSLDLNLSFPLVRYVKEKNGGETRICVYIPEAEFTFRTTLDRSWRIWHPPLWLSVRLSSTNVPNQHRMCVVIDREETIGATKIYHMPFPNVHDDGEICFGYTNMNVREGQVLTEAAAIQMTYNRYFMSQFNHDLMYQNKREALNRQYNALPKDEEIDAELQQVVPDSDLALYLKIARCFKTKSDMYKFPYVLMNQGYKEQF